MAAATAPQRWAVVLNPTKFAEPDRVHADIEQLCAAHGWSPPAWYQTTREDPGHGQAQLAIKDGAELVCPLGGDGTVRAVASGVVGTEARLGLLPAGTGNLLARNLGLPVDSLEAALTVALTGNTSRIDVGEVRWDDGDPDVFLVMAGMGLDAEMMAQVDEGLKRRVGWWAYVASGARAVFRLGFGVRVAAGTSRRVSQHARTVLVGNCGQVTAGVQLIPDAAVDDGLLDVVIASPNSLFAWIAVGLHIITGNRRGHRELVHLRDQHIVAVTREPVEAQLDGDAVGPKKRMNCRVLPAALAVQLPS